MEYILIEMNEKALQTLEFNKIIEQLADLAHTPGGKTKCRELTPMTEKAAIQEAHRRLRVLDKNLEQPWK